MAPIIISSRLPAALINLIAPRDALSPPSIPSVSDTATTAARFHAAFPPSIGSRTLRSALHDAPAFARLRARQATDTVAGSYPGLNAGPDPGTVVGIVLGSVGGFLLLLWLIYTCFQIGGRSDTVSSYGTASVVTRRKHSRHHHRSPARRETVEIRTSRPPPPREPERIVVEERTERRVSQPPPFQPPPPFHPPSFQPPRTPVPAPAPPAPRIVTDDDDDQVVVIEEASSTPPRRHSQHKSKRQSRRRSSSASRRESGFREVDPDRYAGGNAGFREVRRASRPGR